MASYRRHATTPYAVARAKRYLRSHMLETGPRHHGGPCQSYEPGEAVAAMFAAFRHRFDEMVPAPAPQPIAPADCHECGRTKSHKLDCSEGRTA